MVSYFYFFLTEKTLDPKKIGEYLKGPQLQLRKETLFVQYDNNKNVNLILAPTPIKSLPGVKKVLRYLIAPGVKEGGCYGARKFIEQHCENGSS